MNSGKAVVYEKFGKPEEVLRIKTLDAGNLGDDQVLVKWKLSPIHPSDFGKIQGSYGQLPSLPAIAGREGVGEVVEVGKEVRRIKKGTIVQMPEKFGCWRELVVLNEDEVFVVPKSLPLELAAMSFINPPTAWRLLHDFVPLKSGDWIIQNAANSAVGICVIQIARYLGVKTINIVRNSSHEKLLKSYGADVVVKDEGDWHKNLYDLTGGQKPKLALNSIGGESVIKLIKTLSDNAVLVTFGGMTGEKIRFPTRYLIFNNIQLKGFWLKNWLDSSQKLEIEGCMRVIFDLMKKGNLQIPVDKIYNADEVIDAVKHAQAPGRNGKVLIRGW